MIITCAECATQFQLDEARVPESGIRVRCSVCKHAFFVAPTDVFSDEAPDAVTRVVSQVLAAEPGELPEATRDLDAPVEESWEFSDGGRVSGAAGPTPIDPFEQSFEAARAAVDDLLGSPWETPAREIAAPRGGPAPLEEPVPWPEIGPPAPADAAPAPVPVDDPWDTPAWSDEAPAAPPVARDDDADEAPFAAREELPLEHEELALEYPELPVEPEVLRHEREELALDSTPADEAFPLHGIELPEGDALELAGDGGSDELEPAVEGFDDTALGDALEAFETAEHDGADPFEGEPGVLDRESEPPMTASWERDAAVGDDWGEAEQEGSADDDWGDVEQEAPAFAGAEASATEPIPIDFGALLPRSSARERIAAWLARAGNGLGWGAVAILSAIALWGSVAPRAHPSRAPGVQALAGLEATGVAGRWVEHATLGRLYVVSGELHNPGPATKRAAEPLGVRLLGRDGQPIGAATARLAPPLGAPLLRNARAEELRALGERGAQEIARTPLAPGARIPFEAVVLDVPESAMRFDLAPVR